MQLTDIRFPTEVKNRHRDILTVHNVDELLAFVDCDSRFGIIRNLLASRFDDGKIINPEGLISEQSRHMLNLYATQRRFGMCYLFPTVSDCPAGVQISFDIIASKVEEHERNLTRPKRADNGDSTSRTNRKNKVRH